MLIGYRGVMKVGEVGVISRESRGTSRREEEGTCSVRAAKEESIAKTWRCIPMPGSSGGEDSSVVKLSSGVLVAATGFGLEGSL